MSWLRTRLKFLASTPIRNGLGESGRQDDPTWPRFIRTTDIAGPRTLRDDVFASLPPEIARSAMLRPGDIVMTAAGATIGKSLLYQSNEPSCYAGYLVRFRPTHDVDARFISYWMESRPYWGQIEVGKVVSTIENFSASKYQNMSISIPPLPEQRAIADYLDRETARIDALIEKKQRLTQLLEERFQRLIHDVVWGEVDQPVPLMRRVQWNRPIMYGIVLPGPDVPDGVPIVKGGDVEAQRLSPDRLARTTPEIEAPYARARLHGADLVFAIRGGIGDVELVPPELEGANITQDVARVAPAADVDPKWLQLVLRSAEVRRQVEQRVTGATIKGLNIWDLKRVCVPPSDERRQRADLARLSAEESQVYKLVDALRSQASLLAEHRQALITAAVTGVLDLAVVAA